MKKLKFFLIALTTVLLLSSCSSTKKMVNNRPQTFTEYVILNKYSKEYRADLGLPIKITNDMRFGDITSDAFPGIRLQKWLKSEEVK